jgi:hypothetical protein
VSPPPPKTLLCSQTERHLSQTAGALQLTTGRTMLALLTLPKDMQVRDFFEMFPSASLIEVLTPQRVCLPAGEHSLLPHAPRPRSLFGGQ